MRLKYYLRGVGIGIVITTIIFMISMSLHRNDTQPQNKTADDGRSTTISELEESTQKEDAGGTETEEADTGDTEKPNKEKTDTDKTDTDKTTTNQPDTDKKDSDQSDASKKTPTDNTAKNNGTDAKGDTKTNSTSAQQNSSKKETKPDAGQKEKVRFEIKGGEYSDTVCKKLKEEGLIDDAEAFNTYLIQKDYDNAILPGIYDIPKDSTYEEIAALLTTKVE